MKRSDAKRKRERLNRIPICWFRWLFAFEVGVGGGFVGKGWQVFELLSNKNPEEQAVQVDVLSFG